MRVFYICDRQNHCKAPCYFECCHTRNPEFSVNYKEFIPSLNDLRNPELFDSIITKDEITEYWEKKREANS